MKGWMLQWYGTLPAALSEIVAELPGLMSFVSKELSFAVAVCAVVSLLVTVTFDPALTVSAAGANLKLLMVTLLPPPPPPPPLADPPEELELGVELPPPPPPPPQPARAIAAAPTVTSQRVD